MKKLQVKFATDGTVAGYVLSAEVRAGYVEIDRRTPDVDHLYRADDGAISHRMPLPAPGLDQPAGIMWAGCPADMLVAVTDADTGDFLGVVGPDDQDRIEISLPDAAPYRIMAQAGPMWRVQEFRFASEGVAA